MASRKGTAKVAAPVVLLPVGTVLFADNTAPQHVVSGGTNWRIAALIAYMGTAPLAVVNACNTQAYAMGAYKAYHSKIAPYIFDAAAKTISHVSGANAAMAWVSETTWYKLAITANDSTANVVRAERVVSDVVAGNSPTPSRATRQRAAATVETPVAFVPYSDAAKAKMATDTRYVRRNFDASKVGAAFASQYNGWYIESDKAGAAVLQALAKQARADHAASIANSTAIATTATVQPDTAVTDTAVQPTAEVE